MWDTIRFMSPGRPPEAGETRGAYLRVRLASFEDGYVETLRRDKSRSDYVRELIRRDAEEQGIA